MQTLCFTALLADIYYSYLGGGISNLSIYRNPNIATIFAPLIGRQMINKYTWVFIPLFFSENLFTLNGYFLKFRKAELWQIYPEWMFSESARKKAWCLSDARIFASMNGNPR